MQQQTQEPINFNVNYHGGIIAAIRVRQYDTKEKTVMARERMGHPPLLSRQILRLHNGKVHQ